MATFPNSINEIEGGAKGEYLGSVRNRDEELDNALLAPNSVVASRRKKNDVEITKRLSDHGWNRYDIRSVLNKKNHRDSLSRGTDDTYFNDVLKKAGYHRTHSSDSEIVDTGDYSDDGDGDSKTDSSGVTTDSSDIDASRFKNVKF